MESMVKKKMNSLDSKINTLMISIAASIICVISFFYFAGNSGSNQMVICYLGMGISMIIGIGLFHYLSRRFNMEFGTLSKPLFVIVSGLTAFVIIFLIWKDAGKTFGFYTSYSLFEHLPDYVFISILFCSFLFLTYYFLFSQRQAGYLDIPFFAVVGIAIWIEFCYCYHPNIFSENYYCRHHITAVTQSIYNIFYDKPYILESSSVYGHYALFFKPILNVVGRCSPQIIAVIVSFFGVITIAAYALSVYVITPRRITRIVCIVALMSTFKFDGTYLQSNPLRILFPFLILAYLCFWIRKQKVLNPVVAGVGYILCALGIVFQTDSGITTLAAYTLSLWVYYWKNNKIFTKKSLPVYVITILSSIGAVFLAYAMVWAYNKGKGAGLSLSVFLFPILNGSGYTESLYTPIFENGFWICVMPVLLFVSSLIIGLINTAVIDVQTEKETIFLAVIGLFGMSKCYYFLNRSIAGISYIYPYIMLIAAVYIDLFFKKYNRYTFAQACSTGVSVAGMFFLSVAFVFSLSTSISAIGITRENAHYETEPVYSVAEEVREHVPPDTYAVGQGTQEVYSVLGWDPQYHLRDTSDLFGGTYEAMQDEVLKQNGVLLDISISRMLSLEDYGYSLKWKNNCGNDIIFQYYVREEENDE